MALLNSLLSGVSGLKNHQSMMDVVGNNISNVNTIGYKSSRVTFSDSFNQIVRSGRSATTQNGGSNTFQIGLGANLNSIDRNWSQGTFDRTGIVTDLALQGDGLFIVKNLGQTYYTRAGAFVFDEEGSLVNPQNGARVQGKVVNSAGEIPSGNALTDVKVDLNQKIPATATSEVNWIGNLGSSTELVETNTRSVTQYGNLISTTPAGGTITPAPTTIYNDAGTEYTLNTTWTKDAVNADEWDVTWVVNTVPPGAPVVTKTITDLKFIDNDSKWTLDQTSSAKFDGVANKVDIDAALLDFTIDASMVTQTTQATTVTQADNNFSKAQATKTVTGAVTIFDSLGNSHTLDMQFTKTAANQWNWKVTTSADSGTLFNNTGTINFNSNGTIASLDPASIQVEFDPATGASQNQLIVLKLGDVNAFNGITQTSAESTLSVISQDGAAAASLVNLNFDQYGVIQGIFSNGATKDLAQIMTATFINRSGLISTGDNMFTISANSGEPLVTSFGSESGTTVQSQALEQSNVDLSEEFTRMISAQRGFQANARVITTSDGLLQEITQLVR